MSRRSPSATRGDATPTPASSVGIEAFVDIIAALPACVMLSDHLLRPLYVNPSAEEHFGPLDGMGTIPALFVPPSDEEVRRMIERPSVERVLLTYRTADESRVYAAYSVAVFDRGVPRVALVMQDVTEFRRARREAEALARVAAATSFAGTLETTMDALAEAVVAAAGSDACAFFMIEGEPLTVRYLGSNGLPAGYGREFEKVWRAASTLLPSIDAYYSNDQQVMVGARRAFLENPLYKPIHPLLKMVSWDTIVSIPLKYSGRQLGALNCYYAPGREVSRDEIRFLRAVSDQAAVAVENARLFEEVQQKAVLEERQRLARELHDSVSQALYGIGLGSRTALVQLERSPAEAVEPMQYVLSLAEGALAEMRALIFELRPDDLDREGLVAALRRHTESLRLRHGLTVDEDMTDEPQMAPHVRMALYRIGQEALHNVLRHAQAERVTVQLTPCDGCVCLEIIDDGVGFDPLVPRPGHLGLRSMRERAERLAGNFRIESRSGEGTRVRACIPNQGS